MVEPYEGHRGSGGCVVKSKVKVEVVQVYRVFPWWKFWDRRIGIQVRVDGRSRGFEGWMVKA